MKATFRASRVGVLILAVALLPSAAHAAALTITEVMYDAPGSDAGREWVEVYNAGSVPLDLSRAIFFEANTNHKLVVAAGATGLAPSGCAIISNNPAEFAVDYPGYVGTVVKASFSLSNTGEPLALKDASSTLLDSVAYAASLGAKGDGNSLHRAGESFVAGAPNPGVCTGAVPAPLVPKPAVAAAAPIKQPANARAGAAPAQPAPQTAAADKVPAQPLEVPGALWYALLALAGILLLGMAGIWYVRAELPDAPQNQETPLSADEFEIEE